MSAYIPTTQKVEDRYWLAIVNDEGVRLRANEERCRAEFRAWLAEHDAKVRAAERRVAEYAAVVEKVRELSGVGATYGADEFGTFKRILRDILTAAPAEALREHDAALIEGLAFSIKGEPWHNRHQASAYLHEKARQRREEQS